MGINMDEKLSTFSCPSCRRRLLFKQAWMLTKFSEITCAHCHAKLAPIEATVPRIHAFSGLAGGLIGYLFYRSIGLYAAIIVIPWVMLFNCWFSTLVVKFKLINEA